MMMRLLQGASTSAPIRRLVGKMEMSLMRRDLSILGDQHWLISATRCTDMWMADHRLSVVARKGQL